MGCGGVGRGGCFDCFWSTRTANRREAPTTLFCAFPRPRGTLPIRPILFRLCIGGKSGAACLPIAPPVKGARGRAARGRAATGEMLYLTKKVKSTVERSGSYRANRRSACVVTEASVLTMAAWLGTANRGNWAAPAEGRQPGRWCGAALAGMSMERAPTGRTRAQMGWGSENDGPGRGAAVRKGGDGSANTAGK